MEWKFHDDGRVILAHMSDITPFTIVSSFDNTKYVIKLLSNNDCMKYLGIQSTPLGNQNSQYKLSINCKDRCTYSRHRYFGRYYAKLYLNTHLNLQLYHPFTCSSLSHKQYIDIIKQHTLSALSSVNFNKTWSLSLRHDCHLYGGLQLKYQQVEVLI